MGNCGAEGLAGLWMGLYRDPIFQPDEGHGQTYAWRRRRRPSNRQQCSTLIHRTAAEQSKPYMSVDSQR
jgi:hypothetical protein